MRNMNTVSFLTKLLTFATVLHVYLIVVKEHATVKREYQQALYVNRDTCSDPIKRLQYGRFHSCEAVDEMLAVSSLVLTAMDRAFLRFFNAIKTGTLNDLNHMGMLCLTLSLVMCAMAYATSTLYKMWAYHSLQKKYGSTKQPASSPKDNHVAIKMYKND